jgi:hypothetical protein
MAMGKYIAAEGFIYDSWFRVREVSLSYRLSSSVLKNSPLSNLKLEHLEEIYFKCT